MFRACNTVSTSLHGQTSQTVGLLGSHVDSTVCSSTMRMYDREAGSVRAFQWLRKRKHPADMISHLDGAGCLISQNIVRNALDTSLRGQTIGLVGVCSDLSDRNEI